MTTAQQLRLEGKAELLLELSQPRFGALGDRAVARVRAASSDKLDPWTERGLTARSLVDVLE